MIDRPWQPDGDNYRCTIHGITFDRLSTCHECDRAPSRRPESVVDELARPPSGCFDSQQWERWFSKMAGVAERLALDIAREGAPSKKKKKLIAAGLDTPGVPKTPREHTSCAKYLELAVKAASRASEMAIRREDEHLVREREKRILARDHGVH